MAQAGSSFHFYETGFVLSIVFGPEKVARSFFYVHSRFSNKYCSSCARKPYSRLTIKTAHQITDMLLLFYSEQYSKEIASLILILVASFSINFLIVAISKAIASLDGSS